MALVCMCVCVYLYQRVYPHTAWRRGPCLVPPTWVLSLDHDQVLLSLVAFFHMPLCCHCVCVVNGIYLPVWLLWFLRLPRLLLPFLFTIQVAVSRRCNVPLFTPELRHMSAFAHSTALTSFLHAKVINAERASSPRPQVHEAHRE